MFLGGRIFDDGDDSASRKGVLEFTQRITTSPNWLVTLAPVRDGLILAYKTA
jgi:hypothetical protein